MKRIKLFYYIEDNNFGDELSVYIARKKYKQVVYSSPSRCDAVFVGSLLHCFMIGESRVTRLLNLLRPPVTVWGTGFITNPDLNKYKPIRRFDVRACRGFLTLKILNNMSGVKISKNIVIADPGLLASRWIPFTHPEKKYRLGIIPHYVDKNDPLLTKINVSDSVIINIQQPPEVFMEQLAECENILSSSLHGLIAADSLGIPNIRMVLSDKIGGGDFKYNDYYSSFGFNSHRVINIMQRGFSDVDLSDIINSYKIDKGQVAQMQDALSASFPH